MPTVCFPSRGSRVRISPSAPYCTTSSLNQGAFLLRLRMRDSKVKKLCYARNRCPTSSACHFVPADLVLHVSPSAPLIICSSFRGAFLLVARFEGYVIIILRKLLLQFCQFDNIYLIRSDILLARRFSHVCQRDTYQYEFKDVANSGCIDSIIFYH